MNSPASKIPNFLESLKHARAYGQDSESFEGTDVKIAIVTNFTDDVIQKALTGICVAQNIIPDIYTVPFKQYVFELKDPNSSLWKHEAEVTYFFFSITDYIQSEFTSDKSHAAEIVGDIENLCATNSGQIFVQNCASPSDIQHRRLFSSNLTTSTIKTFNKKIFDLSQKYPNLHVLDTDQIILSAGIEKVYDLRNLYASSQPFTNDFLYQLALEWFSVLRNITGRVRKCLVLDLDNTLWGGVVGEVGPLGIELGPDYPGNAYVAFQQVLLEYYNQGIILAINSRNNHDDVMEVFDKNPNMVLKKSHFAAMSINWNTKAENLQTLAKELNIGLDSMIFIDDDGMNRDMVKKQLPEVAVPYFSLQPEEYTHAILNLNEFSSLSVTDEDKKRGEMYAAEQQRKVALTKAPSLEEYIASLNIEMKLHVNNKDVVPRLAQMTQKTNQFNLTTKRSTESEILGWMQEGAHVYSGEITDNFGSYGTTILGVLKPQEKSTALLDICLMSCRVMGRNVEHSFFKAIVEDLLSKGFLHVHAKYIPTAKNAPAKEYLSEIGGKLTEEASDGTVSYSFDLKKTQKVHRNSRSTIKVDFVI